jgi:hypothetical protein
MSLSKLVLEQILDRKKTYLLKIRSIRAFISPEGEVPR